MLKLGQNSKQEIPNCLTFAKDMVLDSKDALLRRGAWVKEREPITDIASVPKQSLVGWFLAKDKQPGACHWAVHIASGICLSRYSHESIRSIQYGFATLGEISLLFPDAQPFLVRRFPICWDCIKIIDPDRVPDQSQRQKTQGQPVFCFKKCKNQSKVPSNATGITKTATDGQKQAIVSCLQLLSEMNVGLKSLSWWKRTLELCLQAPQPSAILEQLNDFTLSSTSFPSCQQQQQQKQQPQQERQQHPDQQPKKQPQKQEKVHISLCYPSKPAVRCIAAKLYPQALVQVLLLSNSSVLQFEIRQQQCWIRVGPSDMSGYFSSPNGKDFSFRWNKSGK